MSEKGDLIERIIAIVIECCNSESRGQYTITAEAVLGDDRHDYVCMTRCILANELRLMGLTTGSIAGHLNRSPQAIRKMINETHVAHFSTNYLYREACRDASRRIEEEFGIGRK